MQAPSGRSEGRGIFVMPDMRVQVRGHDGAGTVRAVGPELAGGRTLKVTFDGADCTVDVLERDAVASWIPEVGDDHAVAVKIDRMQLDCMAVKVLEDPRSLPYIVSIAPFTPHRAFSTRDQLVSWMAERGLKVDGEIPAVGETGHFQIEGHYYRAVVSNTLAFDRIAGVRTRENDGGRWTAATIVQDASGVRTVTIVGSGCAARQVFDDHVWPAADEPMYLYVPGEMTAFDRARDMRDGSYVGDFSGQTLEELRESHPNVQVMASAEVEDQMRVAARTTPVEIDQHEFDAALGVMPPVHSRRHGDVHTFQFSERYTADITWTFAQVGERCFKFRDQLGLATDAIVKRIEAAGFTFEPEEAMGMTP